MKPRRFGVVLSAILAIAASLAVASAPASPADLRSQNVTEVAGVQVPDSTHLEFMSRTVGDETRNYALVGSRYTGTATFPSGANGGLTIVDITDPAQPVVAANVPCKTDNNDIAVVRTNVTVNSIAYDTIIALASNESSGCPKIGDLRGGGISFVGLRAGEAMHADFLGSPVKTPSGSRFSAWKSPAAHTVVAHPTQPLLYSGNQATGDRRPTVEVTDLSAWPPVLRQIELKPAASSSVVVPNGVGPHDITFRPDGKRAYASAIDVSYVLDTTDPMNPTVIGLIQSPNLKVHHEAVLHPNGRHLLVIDEFIAASTDAGGLGTPVCPGGGVHIFDLGPDGAYEAAPVLVGQFYIADTSITGLDGTTPRLDIGCTAHEFNIPAGGRWMPLAWFGAGARVLDLTQLVAAGAQPLPTPVAINELGMHAPALTDTWAAKISPHVPGYIFTSDSSFGLRVLQFTGPLP